MLVSLLAAVSACKSSGGGPPPRPAAVAPGTPAGEPVTQRVDARGGRLATRDGRLVVVVPPGTVTLTDITAQQVTGTALVGVGSGYRLGPAGTKFPRPVTLTFLAGWTTAAIQTLTIAYQDERGFWVHAPGVTRDPAARTVSVATTHFSDWSLVSADPTQDMAGSFTISSNVDVPSFIDTQTFTAKGTALLTFFGQDTTPGVLDRAYLFSPTVTLQPLTSVGAACSIAAPVAYTETNVAEARNQPDRFFWGTGAFWHVTCGGQTEILDALFDTEGVNRFRCSRSYVGAPIVSADSLKGSYLIDCASQQRGTISATWDFERCGGACTSANPCRTAVLSCASGTATCTDTGNVADGTTCGTNLVCSAGACTACTAGVACTPLNPCHTGTTSCSTGTSVCVDSGVSVANGASCGTNQVCSAGLCSACMAGVACTPAAPNNCHAGTTSCSTGTSVCVDALTNLADGASCGLNLVCSGGTCGACTAGVSCPVSATNPCHAGTTSCSTGTSVCMDNGTPLPDTTDCSLGGPDAATCQVGVCTVCTSVACVPPANPCHTGTTSCLVGSVGTCIESTTPVTDGTTCGTNLVCSAGACTACTAGVSCPIVANPCHNGTTSCSTGTSVCVDAATNVTDGTTCGTNLVCSAGTCAACTAGVACTPANPCHTGTTSCATGASVCADTTVNQPNGTSCGTNLVCSAGACAACIQGDPCTLQNSCVATAAIVCATGVPVCTATASVPDGTTDVICASPAAACTSGSCLPTPCAAGACVPANPCHTGTVACGPPDTCAEGLPPTLMPDGVSCGTNLVCGGGACLACPGAAAVACQSTNPCALTAAISCASGVPVCTDATFQPENISCGPLLTCQAGVCR